MKISGTQGQINIIQDGFSYDVEIETTVDVPNRTVTIENIEIFNSEKLRNPNFDGVYPAIDEDRLTDEIENEIDWIEEETNYLEYLSEM